MEPASSVWQVIPFRRVLGLFRRRPRKPKPRVFWFCSPSAAWLVYCRGEITFDEWKAARFGG